MMAQPVLRASGHNKKHTFFTDSYYTRPSLAKLLLQVTDGNATIIGTIKMTHLKQANRTGLLAAVEVLKKDTVTRGTWVLLQVYDEDGTTVMDKTGIIVYKDKRPVCFFTNNLLQTPQDKYMSCKDVRAVRCVHGLAPLKRWIGDKSLMPTTLMAPAIVVAYNRYMNLVNRFDQL